MEFFINLFEQDDKSGNKPHYKALFKIEGVPYECAFWQNKDGKKGFSGKAKIKETNFSAPKKDNTASIDNNFIPF